MSAETSLQRLAVIHEVFLTACRLFALDARFAEMQMNYLLADHNDPKRLGELTGKYVKRLTGYVHVKGNGNAAALAELPEGVSLEDVVIDDLDVSGATPLQDRLRAIARSLRSGSSNDPAAEEMAEAIDHVLEACRPDNGERWSDQIKERAGRVFDADGEADLSGMSEAERVHWFLDQLGDLAGDLQAGPTADGKTVGGILAIRAMMLARGASATNPLDEADALMVPLFFVMNMLPGRIEDVAGALSSYLVRRGGAEDVRRAAEGLKAEGDAHITGALDGDAVRFYASLYPAAAYELAVVYLGQAAAAAIPDPDEKRRWAKLAVNAEERAVRVGTALGFALMNLDGAWLTRHQHWLQQVRQEQGDAAARLKAKDLINNQFFYPRAFLPVLLDIPVVSDDRRPAP